MCYHEWYLMQDPINKVLRASSFTKTYFFKTSNSAENFVDELVDDSTNDIVWKASRES